MHHRDLQSWYSYFDSYGYDCQTVELTILGQRHLFTVDPENIKAFLATQFEDYGKGERLHGDFAPFLGDSIFSTDGALWRASRQLIRPQFIKQRVSDLSTFEDHIQILFGCLAEVGDGGTIDVNDLVLRYTLDVATEFLLGKSVDSMHNPAVEFAKAFAEVQRVQNLITRTG